MLEITLAAHGMQYLADAPLMSDCGRQALCLVLGDRNMNKKPFAKRNVWPVNTA